MAHQATHRRILAISNFDHAQFDKQVYELLVNRNLAATAEETSTKRKRNQNVKEIVLMKGYIVNNGYMGYIGGVYQLFASESDYREYMED